MLSIDYILVGLLKYWSHKNKASTKRLTHSKLSVQTTMHLLATLLFHSGGKINDTKLVKASRYQNFPCVTTTIHPMVQETLTDRISLQPSHLLLRVKERSAQRYPVSDSLAIHVNQNVFWYQNMRDSHVVPPTHKQEFPRPQLCRTNKLHKQDMRVLSLK